MQIERFALSNITHLTKTTQLLQLTQLAQQTPVSDEQMVAAMAKIILSIATFFTAILFAIFFTRWFQQWRRARQDRKYQHYLQQMRQLTLQDQDSDPAQDHLPTVRPAWMFDASDTAPECPECYIEHLRFRVLPRDDDGGYVMPAGEPVICARHSATTLAKALREKETTR